MCEYALYRSHPDSRCDCRWLAITRTCFDGGGFSTCPTLLQETNGDGRMHEAVPAIRAGRGSCPRHALRSRYDLNQMCAWCAASGIGFTSALGG